MHSSFMPYAEYVILERALPRVEDGLKPVQRRILYAMSELELWPSKPHKKSARIVGETLGKYHPHGDTSVYDAMVRMAQDFSLRAPLIDGHGNFGSMDGDSAAAMRYTEARLAPIALEMLRDLKKDTVDFALNFDDSLKEPTMLPSRYPNLLVNGASGIAVGLATNIPPHNLGEVIDATIARIKNQNISLDEIMSYIKAPDFPTGGMILDSEEIKKAYETGRGKIAIRAKVHLEKQKNGKTLIVITQLPYEVKKAVCLEKILAVSMQKKEMFAGIDDIRDESDREGLRAVIEVKKGTDVEKLLACLYKYTDLQISFGVNMVAIANGLPKQMGLLEILDHYIRHQRNVITRRTKYDLENAEKREHILSGLIIAVENIDRVIAIIRGSKTPGEANQKLQLEFALTKVQAQAILDMRLARLTNLEIKTLRQEYEQVIKLIARLREILNSRNMLDLVIINELTEIKQNYQDPRRSTIEKDTVTMEINEDEFKVKENCALILTKDRCLKRLGEKLFKKGWEGEDIEYKNQVRKSLEVGLEDKICVFTNLGNMYVIRADDVKEGKWKEPGKALNTLIAGIQKNETVINLYPQNELTGRVMYFATKGGMIKGVSASEFVVKKSKIAACGLKEQDELIYIALSQLEPNFTLITKTGMSICFSKEEISIMGRTAKGVMAITLKTGDEVICCAQTGDQGAMVVVSNNGYAKKTPIAQYHVQGRNGKGLKTITFAKSKVNGEQLSGAVYVTDDMELEIGLLNGEMEYRPVEDLPEEKRDDKGQPIIMALLGNEVSIVDAHKREGQQTLI